jgi:hypothetical protein
MRGSGVRIGGLAFFAAGALLLGAATTNRILAFSPENREAQALGPLNAYLEGQGGNGVIWLKLPSGEVVKGRFEVKVGGSVGVWARRTASTGSVHGSGGISLSEAGRRAPT